MAPQNSNESVGHHDLVSSVPSKTQKAHDHHRYSKSDDPVLSQSTSVSQSPKTHEFDDKDQTGMYSQSKCPKSPRWPDYHDDDDEEEAAAAVQGPSRTPVYNTTAPIETEAPVLVEDTGRERLKRHRVEVAGRVWIPDLWGQEDLLKDWTDCTAFDASLANSNIISARAALVQEGRRANSTRLKIENRC